MDGRDELDRAYAGLHARARRSRPRVEVRQQRKGGGRARRLPGGSERRRPGALLARRGDAGAGPYHGCERIRVPHTPSRTRARPPIRPELPRDRPRSGPAAGVSQHALPHLRALARQMTRDYTPLPRWKGGHWMTLFAWGKPRNFPALPPAQPRYFDVAPGSRVLAHCHWQPRPWEHPTLILL